MNNLNKLNISIKQINKDNCILTYEFCGNAHAERNISFLNKLINTILRSEITIHFFSQFKYQKGLNSGQINCSGTSGLCSYKELIKNVG